MNNKTTIGEKIRLIRTMKGLSQENISQDLGLSQKAYSKIERGETKLTLDMIEKISMVFQMEPQDILNFNPETFIQTNSTYNSQSGGNNHFSVDNDHVKSLKEELHFLKSQLQQKDELIATLMKKLK